MAKIGVFDSGYGGLTILREIRKVLPEYDYIYLGDNARAPYGTHSFDVIYRYTLQAEGIHCEHRSILLPKIMYRFHYTKHVLFRITLITNQA